MLGLIEPEELETASLMIYAHYYGQNEEEYGMNPTHWEHIDRPDMVRLLTIVAYRLGEIANVWGQDPGLVLHHSGIERPWGRPLYYLLLGSLGTGYGIEDEYEGALERSSTVLNKWREPGTEFEDAPVCDDMYDLYNLATDEVQDRMSRADSAPRPETWPYQTGDQVTFDTRTSPGDKISGGGTVIGCLRYGVGNPHWRVVVLVDEGHPDRGGSYLAMEVDDIEE